MRSVVVEEVKCKGDRKLRVRYRSRVKEFGKNYKEVFDFVWFGF